MPSLAQNKELILRTVVQKQQRGSVYDTRKNAQLGTCRAPNDSSSKQFRMINSLYFFPLLAALLDYDSALFFDKSLDIFD